MSPLIAEISIYVSAKSQKISAVESPNYHARRCRVSVSPFFSVATTVPSIPPVSLYHGHGAHRLQHGSWTVLSHCPPSHVAVLPQASRRASGRPAAAYRWWSPARNTECTLHPWRDQATNSWSRHVEVARRDSARAVICRRQVATFRSKSRQCLHISLYISSKSPKISARFSDYVSHPRHPCTTVVGRAGACQAEAGGAGLYTQVTST